MLFILLDASFYNRIAQGVITGFFMMLIIGVIVFFIRRKSAKKEESRPRKKMTLKLLYNNFFPTTLNKGYRRLIIVGSVLLPIVFGLLVYYLTRMEITEDDGEVIETVYYESYFILWTVIFCLLYWVFYLVVLWVINGFRENSTNHRN